MASLCDPRVPQYSLIPAGAYVQQLLESDSAFLESTTFREQCAHSCAVLRDRHQPKFTWSVIAQIFGVARSTIQEHVALYKLRGNSPGTAGRPSCLTREELEELVQQITECYDRARPLSIHDLLAYISNNFDLNISPDTLYHILQRESRIRSITALPCEDKRLQVPEHEIIHYFHCLAATISGVPPHFVFNVDEMGHQDWADAGKKTCYVPSTCTHSEIRYPVSRTGKRLTLIACICADGSHLRPCLIIPRKTFENELFALGFAPDQLEIYSQSKSFIDIDIFNDWFKDTFVPTVTERKQKYQYDGPTYLIMDNCSAHHGRIFDELCQQHNIVPIMLPPHSSNQLQPLDLSTFGATKKNIHSVNTSDKLNIQTKHIVRVLVGFLRAVVPPNVIMTFRNAGISIELDPDSLQNPESEIPRLICKVTPETARCLFKPIEIPDEFQGLFVDGEEEDETEYMLGPEEAEEEMTEDREFSEFVQFFKEARKHGTPL
jgi:hypothetical protein